MARSSRSRKELGHPATRFATSAKHLAGRTPFLVEIELPGIEESAIELQVKNRVLSVKAERKLQVPSDKFRWHRVETASGLYERVLSLPEGIDVDGIHAGFRNGLLSISLPKLRRQEDCRRININAG